jgi:transcriptional regulator with XRE-family HTH domain
MTSSEEIAAALHELGWTQKRLAGALLLGRGGERTVRRWLEGDTKRVGPALAAIRLLLGQHRGAKR